jgi:hypothetical protein
MKKNILTLSLFLFTSSFLFSQNDTIRTSYKVDLTGVLNQVNGSSRTTLNFNALNTVKWKKFESSVSTDYQLVSNDGTNAVNDFTVRLQPRIIDKKYSIFSFGQLSSLESKKITQRFEGGLGGGLTAYKVGDLLQVNLSYATLFYNNNFQDLTNRNGFRHSPRIVIYGKSEKSKISYSAEAFYQPAFTDVNDYILRTKSTIGFDLNKKFTITLMYNTWFESYYILGAINDVKTFTVGTSFKID